jgi:hypothetical protein
LPLRSVSERSAKVLFSKLIHWTSIANSI